MSSSIVYRNKIILQSDTPTILQPIEVDMPTSGSYFTDAGWRSDDSNPTSGSLIFGSGSLYDGDLTTIVTPDVSTNWSIGCKLPHSGSIINVTLFDKGSYPGLYFSGSNTPLKAYLSLVNNRWAEWFTIVKPVREWYSGSIYKIDIECPSAVSGSYFKLNAYDGALFDPMGNTIRFTEMRVRMAISSYTASGSIYPMYEPESPYSVPSPISSPEIPVIGYGE